MALERLRYCKTALGGIAAGITHRLCSSHMEQPAITHQGSNARIRGLDTLRFIAAMWVVFSHCGEPPLTEGLDRGSLPALIVQGIYGNLFAGVPAVIVFFVISGFCIHYPHRNPGSFSLLPFLVRRYLRICIPMAVAILLSRPLHVNLALFQNSILWSLLAEIIYYSLYPILRRLNGRFGWNKIILASFVAAYGVILAFPDALDYDPFGPALSWLVAFPCWLLGCRLAEIKFDWDAPAPSPAQVWCWRGGIWFLVWFCSVLRFHSPISYPWTLNFFAIAVFFWLRVEIIAFRVRPPRRILEWAGQWSYSLYLMHTIAEFVYVKLPWPNFGFNLNWCLKMAFILAVSYVFYLLVEKPGHYVARRLSQCFRRTTSAPEAGSVAAPPVA